MWHGQYKYIALGESQLGEVKVLHRLVINYLLQGKIPQYADIVLSVFQNDDNCEYIALSWAKSE